LLCAHGFLLLIVAIPMLHTIPCRRGPVTIAMTAPADFVTARAEF
jgi:hypothetical protein